MRPPPPRSGFLLGQARHRQRNFYWWKALVAVGASSGLPQRLPRLWSVSLGQGIPVLLPAPAESKTAALTRSSACSSGSLAPGSSRGPRRSSRRGSKVQCRGGAAERATDPGHCFTAPSSQKCHLVHPESGRIRPAGNTRSVLGPSARGRPEPVECPALRRKADEPSPRLGLRPAVRPPPFPPGLAMRPSSCRDPERSPAAFCKNSVQIRRQEHRCDLSMRPPDKIL